MRGVCNYFALAARIFAFQILFSHNFVVILSGI